MEQTKAVVTVSRTYRRIDIYETPDGFEIIGALGQRYEFATWLEACAFVDAWYLVQFVTSNSE